MSIFIVDTEGTLIFYNGPAEVILGKLFGQAGEMPADEARNAIAQEDRPMMMALSERRPISRTVWMRCGEREWRHINITAFPLIGEGGQFFGAQMISNFRRGLPLSHAE